MTMTMAMAALTVFFFIFLAGATSAAAQGHRISRESSLSREELAEMAGYGEDKISTILVTGSVLCDYHHDHHLPSQPVSGAVVAIKCRGSRRSRRRRSSSSRRGRRVMIKGVTDEYGDFTIDLPSSLHAIPNLHKRCSLTLLHLPTHLSRRCIKPPSSSSNHHPRNRPMLLLTSSDDEDDNGARIYSAGTIKLRSRQLDLLPSS